MFGRVSLSSKRAVPPSPLPNLSFQPDDSPVTSHLYIFELSNEWLRTRVNTVVDKSLAAAILLLPLSLWVRLGSVSPVVGSPPLSSTRSSIMQGRVQCFIALASVVCLSSERYAKGFQHCLVEEPRAMPPQEWWLIV